MIKGRLLILLVAAALMAAFLLPATRFAQAQGTGSSYVTPSGQIAHGAAILCPTGPITNGQPVYGPPGPANGCPFYCTNCSPSAPTGASSNPVNGTIAVTNVFQPLIAQNLNRKGCAFQNQGTHTMYISVAATPTVANSLQVPAGAVFYCASGSTNIVITDALSISGTATDAYAGQWQ